MSDNIFGDVIYSYSRAQAIEDEVLFDVTDGAKEAGFKIPTAMTAGVHGKIDGKEGVEGIKGLMSEFMRVAKSARGTSRLSSTA